MLATFSRRISIHHLWALTVLVGIFVFVNTHPIRPHDFWWHLAIGREILSTGKIPAVDAYSYTMAGQPYASYQMYWLMEIALYSLYRLGGPALVVFAQSLVVTTAYAILLFVCWRVSGRWRAAALAVLFALALGFNDWNVRPQTIAFLIGSASLWAIYGYRRRPHLARLVVFPLGMLVWVNSHGTFLVGLVLLGIWLGDEGWRSWMVWRQGEGKELTARLGAPAAALALTALACLANPRGADILSYPRALTGNTIVQNLVTEWAPPTFNTLGGALFLTGLLFSALVLALSPRRPDFLQLATFLVFALIGLRAARGAVWFGLAMAPVLADHFTAIASRHGLKGIDSDSRIGSPVVNLLLLAVLTTLALASLPWFKQYVPLSPAKAGLVSAETPVKATQFLLAAQPPGRLFHDMAFGSYLIWAAQPDYKVFVDPRIELYPAETWRDYLMVINALPGWEERLRAYGVRTLMLDPQDQAELIEQVEHSANWRRLYRDDAAVIYTRQY